MKASICIPTLCNTEDRLAKLIECVDSALRQTHSEFEVIVADNKSEIDVGERLKRRFEGDARLMVFRNERTIPMPANFNEAIARSTGEIVKPLCDDDLIHPDLIRGCAPLMERVPYLRIRDKQFSDASQVAWSPRYDPHLAPSHSWKARYLTVDAISPTCTLFTRKVWEEMGRYVTSVNHVWDYVFAMEAQLKYGFTLSTPVGCAFRIWEGSSTVRNRDPFRNFNEMHVLYRRNRSPSLTMAKVLYVSSNLRRALMHPGQAGEVISIVRRYFS